MLGLFVLSGDDAQARFDKAMRSLRADNAHRDFGNRVLPLINQPANSKEDITRLVVTAGVDSTDGYIALRILLGISTGQTRDIFTRLFDDDFCYRLTDLKIRGDDLIAIGITGSKIGEILNSLLMSVALWEVKNEKKALLAMAKKLHDS